MATRTLKDLRSRSKFKSCPRHEINRQQHARKWERGGVATEDILHPHAHWDPLAARLAPEPTEHPPTAAPKERGPSPPRAHLCVDQLCHGMVVTMSPVAAGYCSSLSWFGSLIASRNEVLHWPRSVHGGHHELRQHGQDRKVCWVRSRLGDLKFSESTAWSRILLNRIVHRPLSRIEYYFQV